MKYCWLFLSMLISHLAYSQLKYEKRLEFDLKDGYQDEVIYQFKENGFLILSRAEKSERDNLTWKVDFYDKDLELKEIVTFTTEKRAYIDEIYQSDQHIHILSRSGKGSFEIITIDPSDYSISRVSGSLLKKSYVSEMVVIGEIAYLTISIKRSDVLMSVNWKTGKSKLIPIIIPGFSEKKISLKRIQALENSNEVVAFYVGYGKKKRSDIIFVILDEEGNKKSNYIITAGIEQNIIAISATKTSKDEYIFTGTYGLKTYAVSQGIFIGKGSASSLGFIRFYPFTQLKNFLSYLPKKTQEKIERKRNKKESKGKEAVFNYLIADHPILETKDGYLLLGEAYYPTYRSETRTTYTTVNGVSTATTTTVQVFDGYQYTHAFLVKFDLNGQLQWDQTFAMWGAYKPFYVKRFIEISDVNKDALSLVFVSSNRIYLKAFDYHGEVLKDKTSDAIETGYSGDKTRSSFSNIEFWYDQYYLAYGSQTIKNKENKGVERKRKVYFISKIKTNF